MKKLSLMLSLLALFATTAFAGGPVNVRQINVNNLSMYEGKFVTAFYLSARASGFSYGNNNPRVNRVLEKSSPVLIKNGKATIPRSTVIESGFSVLNYIKIVIHSSKQNIVLKNIDGTTPPGKGQGSGSTRYVRGFYVAKDKVSPLGSPVPATVRP